jgi:hypothetical protein
VNINEINLNEMAIIEIQNQIKENKNLPFSGRGGFKSR